jgi:hypothetical protein
MKNKNQLEEIRAAIISLAQQEIVKKTKLGNEIGYFLGVQEENDDFEEVDDVDAVFEAEKFAENNDDHSMLKLIRDLLIKAKFYRIMPREEIDRCMVTSGTVWNFIKDKVAYTSDFCYWDFSKEASQEAVTSSGAIN